MKKGLIVVFLLMGSLTLSAKKTSLHPLLTEGLKVYVLSNELNARSTLLEADTLISEIPIGEGGGANVTTLDIIAVVEEAIENKADIVVFKEPIQKTKGSSLLEEYLKKVSQENSILLMAPKMAREKSLFSSWNPIPLLNIKAKIKSVRNFRLRQKIKSLAGKKWKVAKACDLKAMDRYFIYL
ncbi:MAG: hypothetical protein AB8E15_05300 [Bdellovibrionales bacterium]